MRRHDQVRQQGLFCSRRLGWLVVPSLDTPQFARDSVRTQRLQNMKLHAAGRCGAAVGEVDDFALTEPINGGVRLFDETPEAFRQPMIPASLPALTVHPLLPITDLSPFSMPA